MKSLTFSCLVNAPLTVASNEEFAQMLLSTFGTGISPALTTQRKFSADFYSKYQLL